MKKKFAAIMLVLLFAVQTFVPCLAVSSDIKVMLDNEAISFDVPPMIMSERTMVPVRAIFEALDYEVTWDAEKRAIKAVREDNEINMYIDFYTFWSNGTAMQTDVAPCIVDGRTLVPVRVISEASGCLVEWDAEAHIVHITSKDEEGKPIEPSASPEVSASPEATATPEPTPAGITLDKTTLTINEGKSETLKTTIKAWLSDERVRWSSSDARIATVTDKGVVWGIEAGTCTITAKAGKESVSCEVTVKNVPKEPSIQILGYNTTKLFVDNREYLTISIFNGGEYPLTIKGNATYTYLSGAEGEVDSIVKEAKYDIYTAKLSSPETVIKPKTYELITFTRTKDKPSVGGKTLKKDFEETLSFAFEYDGKTYTGKKVKRQTGKLDDNSKPDFTY